MSPPPRFTCPWRTDLPGELLVSAEAAFWGEVPEIGLRETVSGLAPAQSTRVQLARNDNELRMLFSCQDACPWATLTERDGPLWTEEVVELFLDPFGDGESYFEIELNPLGAVCDLVLRRIASGWRKDFRWRAEGLRTAVRRHAGGWTGEFSLPIDALGPDLRGAREWRVNFFRVDRPGGAAGDHAAELSAWSPTGVRNFHVWERFGFLAMPGGPA